MSLETLIFDVDGTLAEHLLSRAQPALVGGPWLGLRELRSLHETSTRDSSWEMAPL